MVTSWLLLLGKLVSADWEVGSCALGWKVGKSPPKAHVVTSLLLMACAACRQRKQLCEKQCRLSVYQHCSSDDQSSKSLLRPAFSLDCVRSKYVYASDCALFFNHGTSLRNQRGRAALPCRAVHLPCFDKPSIITSINQICTGMGKSCYRTSDSASCFPYIRDVRLV